MADHEIYEDRIALEHVRRQLSTDSEDFPDEVLDPRIQTELEKLNKASEEINRLELELDDARSSFRQALSESTQKLNALAKKLGSCVEKARPYYDARVKAKEIHMESQKVALRYERACSMHEAAKEMVQLAEQGYMDRQQISDPAWQEMLNHATMKVNEAEKERNESETEHEKITQMFKLAEERVQFLQRDLKRAIAKSNLSTRRSLLQLSSIANQHWLECLPYFEMKIKFNQLMEDQKLKVSTLEEDVSSAKALYSQALHSLEAISDEIHRKRLERRKNLQLGIRSAGVGAEDPAPPPPWDGRVDGSSVSPRYSCSDPLQATVSSREKNIHRQHSRSDVDASDADVFSGSILYESPERARSQSYRSAIETSQTNLPAVSPEDSLCLADYDENFEVSCLEDDYMDLPKTHSPRGRVNPQVKRSDSLASADRSISLSVQETEPSRSQTKPITIAGHLSHNNLKGEGGSGSPSTSLHKSPKLQGLILRVDASLDPLQKSQPQHQYSGASVNNTIAASSRSGPSTPVASSTGRIVAVSSEPVNNDPLNVSAVLGSSSQDSPAKKINQSKKTRVNSTREGDTSSLSSPAHERKSLRIPSSSDMSQLSVEDSSDTESIASTGPMFDDDQIEFLSMDFSKQASKDDLAEAFQPWKRQSWNRMSLPPRLGYLEGYLNRKLSDTSKQSDENTLENICENLSETVPSRNAKSSDFVNLENSQNGDSEERHVDLVVSSVKDKSYSQKISLASGDCNKNNDRNKGVISPPICPAESDSMNKDSTSERIQKKSETTSLSQTVDMNHVTNSDDIKSQPDEINESIIKTKSLEMNTPCDFEGKPEEPVDLENSSVHPGLEKHTEAVDNQI